MRRYLLDTPLIAAYLLNRPGAVSLVTPWIQNREASTSILVYGEVIEYISGRANFPTLQAQLRGLLKELSPLFLAYSIMDRYAAIRRALRPKGNLIGDIDTLIAATALERHLTVVTTDEDFQRVPDLKTMLMPKEQLSAK
jgi:predicted nucleic acid-binding protein